jgi:hypothetical protein
VAPETLAAFREAVNELGRAGTPVDDDTVLMLMARNVLGGPRDEGRTSYQIALSVCSECGQAWQQASGELVPVGPQVVAMAACDGQYLGQGAVAKESAHVGARARQPVDSDARTPGARAKQSVRPVIRRAVLRRDQHRCVVPGCRNSRFLEIHHVVPRAEGGENDADNLITLCGAHHRAAHRGELTIAGSVSSGIRFEHADGSNYGAALDPDTAEIRTKAFAALRNLGFQEREIRGALANRFERGDARATSVERLVRDTLSKLTEPRAYRAGK